jgi:HEPN domain-containing protein
MTVNRQKNSCEFQFDFVPPDCEALLKFSEPQLGEGELNLFIVKGKIRFYSIQPLLSSITDGFLYLAKLSNTSPSLREIDHYLRLDPRQISFESTPWLEQFYLWMVKSYQILQNKLLTKARAAIYEQGDRETKMGFLQELLDKISLETDREIMAKLIDIEDDILIMRLASNEHQEQKLDFLTQKIAQYLGQDWVNIVPEY